MAGITPRIAPCLWFKTEAEVAARFYVSVFANSRIDRITRYGKVRHDTPGIAEGDVMTVSFVLDGAPFVALNGGPGHGFTEAVSFVVHCATQEELDHYWDRLSENGDEGAQVCGWLKDKYGVSWQVIPQDLNDMLQDPDGEKSQRVMEALLKMKKLDIEALGKAYRG